MTDSRSWTDTRAAYGKHEGNQDVVEMAGRIVPTTCIPITTALAGAPTNEGI